MICVYDIGNEDYSGNGDAVLLPVKCSHRQAAAGKYDLTIVHPLDELGKWMHLVPEAVIRAPVPEETIENAFSGLEADVYTVNNNGTAMRSGASEPTVITYEAWREIGPYEPGSKVTFGNKNWQCTYYDHSSIEARVIPPNSAWWVEIARMTPGDPVLVTLKAGTELYYVEDAGDGWYKMSTLYGMEGYVKSSQMTYSRHLTPAETQPRTITTQLFRIKTVAVDSANNQITATAEHVSYDLSGILVEDASIHQKNPAQALAWIEQAFMMEYRGTIATNMTSDDDGTYTGDIKGKNATYALLDPDKGIVSEFEAMFRRDNWDVFVMRKETTDRGFQLRYGKNMIGVNWSIKSDGLVTRVVPVAKAEDGSDLYLDLDGERWVDSPLINNYPVIRMERIKVPGQVGKDDGTETATTWTEETLREEMEKKAGERFSVDKADLLVHDITVNFEMLGDTEEHKALRGLENVLLYDRVLAINDRIGLSVTVEVSEIEYDCIRQKITGLKLTNVNAYGGRTVSGFNVFNNSITGDKLTDDVSETIIGTTKDDAVQESKSYTNSAIYNLQSWVTDNFVEK